jgi:hypothetical protein
MIRDRLGGLRLVRAETSHERRLAAAFRQRVFFERRQVLFDEILEARRDRHGYVFLLLDGRTVVATARVLPYPSALSPMQELGGDFATRAADSQVGRIAAVRTPLGLRASLLLLVLGALWMRAHTPHERYLAYCHPKLLELYRQVGARDLNVSCVVPGRDEAHAVVTGRYDDAARRGLQLLAIEEADAAEMLACSSSSLGFELDPCAESASRMA